MFRMTRFFRSAFGASLALILSGTLLTGCPPEGPPFDDPPIDDPPIDDPMDAYDRGLDDGFAEDEEYWAGYWDGYDTVDFGPIYYTGHEIPYLDEYSYEAGYWDGVWYAYNDGYFVNYHYAFILGWSEGYDLAFRADYLSFLERDQHTEFLDGGWSDGYHDGFSEGRIFGAHDYEQGLPFDWLDALWDYEDEVDLYFGEIDLGTGEFGPVILYNYGENPHELVSKTTDSEEDTADVKRLERMERRVPAIRGDVKTREKTREKLDGMFREMTQEARAEYDYQPSTSLRDEERELEELDSSWIERIDTYLSSTKERAELPESGRAESARAVTHTTE